VKDATSSGRQIALLCIITIITSTIIIIIIIIITAATAAAIRGSKSSDSGWRVFSFLLSQCRYVRRPVGCSVGPML